MNQIQLVGRLDRADMYMVRARKAWEGGDRFTAEQYILLCKREYQPLESAAPLAWKHLERRLQQLCADILKADVNLRLTASISSNLL